MLKMTNVNGNKTCDALSVYSAAISFLLVPMKSSIAASSKTDLLALLACSTISRSSSKVLFVTTCPFAFGGSPPLLLPITDFKDCEIFLEMGTWLT